MRLDRPIGYILLFYPICFSIFAFSSFNIEVLRLLIIFLIGSIVMRSAGCIINDLLDRDIDIKNVRTHRQFVNVLRKHEKDGSLRYLNETNSIL